MHFDPLGPLIFAFIFSFYSGRRRVVVVDNDNVGGASVCKNADIATVVTLMSTILINVFQSSDAIVIYMILFCYDCIAPPPLRDMTNICILQI